MQSLWGGSLNSVKTGGTWSGGRQAGEDYPGVKGRWGQAWSCRPLSLGEEGFCVLGILEWYHGSDLSGFESAFCHLADLGQVAQWLCASVFPFRSWAGNRAPFKDSVTPHKQGDWYSAGPWGGLVAVIVVHVIGIGGVCRMRAQWQEDSSLCRGKLEGVWKRGDQCAAAAPSWVRGGPCALG